MDKVNPKAVRNLRARERLEVALNYQRQIAVLVDRLPVALKEATKYIPSQTDEWINALYRLAKIIDTYESNPIIAHDKENLPKELDKLRSQFATELNHRQKKRLQEAIAVRERLLGDLQRIMDNIKITDSKIDGMVANFEKVYTALMELNPKSG